MRTRTRAGLAAMPLLLALTLPGCGGDFGVSDADGVASVNTPAPGDDGSDSDDGEGTGAPGAKGKSRGEMLLEAAQCLRDHGVDVEDPPPGEGIHIQNDGDPTKANAALKACGHLFPPAEREDPGQEREDMMAMAACMRENGVEHFADPKPGEGINIGPEVAEDPDFPAAEEACNGSLGAGAPVTN